MDTEKIMLAEKLEELKNEKETLKENEKVTFKARLDAIEADIGVLRRVSNILS